MRSILTPGNPLEIQQSLKKGKVTSECTSFLVAESLLLVAHHCVAGLNGETARVLMPKGQNLPSSFDVVLPPVTLQLDAGGGGGYALLRVNGKPGGTHGVLKLANRPPKVGEALAMVYYRGAETQMAVTSAKDCAVVRVSNNEFEHGCDTGPGSGGAPVLTADGSAVLGIHYMRTQNSTGQAVRVDLIAKQVAEAPRKWRCPATC